jgi:molecular chaperone HscB
MDDARVGKDIPALDALLKEMRTQAKALQQQVANEIVAAPTQAALTVRKLRFIDKVSEDVNQLIAQLEN